MNFRLKSVKVDEQEGVRYLTVTVESQGGATIKTNLQAKDVPALDTLEVDITREVKRVLREDLRQLELKDEGYAARAKKE